MTPRFISLISLVLSLALAAFGCSGSSSSGPSMPPGNPPPADGICAPQECGPAPSTPAGTCADGSTSGPTGQCLRDGTGTCSWEMRECPVAGTPTPTPDAGACVRTGCSNSVCVEPGKEVMTTCEMRPEYECYATAKCERQANGSCAFTQTPALSQCLTSAHK